ncbi:hypothetical protein F5883DRAFT_641627 [Diaporthe sp. PMI_573]|nr:hypothetical protein F5883DRAFT_641627 [Diaporthaceae sp. PMI_573]
MSSRLDYLVRKLDDLEDDIRREKREYDKARDRYDRMRSRDILEDLKRQLLGYQTEHDHLRRARPTPEKARPNQPPPQHHHHPKGRPTHPPNAQQGQQHMPPPPQQRKTYPHRPAPQHNGAYPPRNNHGPSGNGAGQTRGQPGNNSNRNYRPAPPRPHQKTQTLDYEVEEPDGKTYVVRGGAVFRDFDPARDKARTTE